MLISQQQVATGWRQNLPASMGPLMENKLSILINCLQSKSDVLRGIQMTDETISNLERFVAKQILKQPNRTIAADEPLISSGLIDSFSLMDLALYVEDTFGARIEDTELNADTFDTLNQLSALIASRK
jgi:acyl carrier protein